MYERQQHALDSPLTSCMTQARGRLLGRSGDEFVYTPPRHRQAYHTLESHEARRTATNSGPPLSRQALLMARKGDSRTSSAQSFNWASFRNDGRRHSLYHKPNIFNLRNTSEIGHFRSTSLSVGSRKLNPEQTCRRSIKRSDLEKPLPPIPQEAGSPSARHKARHRRTFGRVQSWLAKDSTQSADPGGGASPSRSEDTTLYKRWAPAVTHETIIRNVHEIWEEQITREIHNYQVHYREQPIFDFEILPARHFIPVGDGFVEVSEDQLRGIPSAEWFAAEISSKLQPMNDGSVVVKGAPMGKLDSTSGNDKDHTSRQDFKRPELTPIAPLPAVSRPTDTGQYLGFLHGFTDSPSDTWRGELMTSIPVRSPSPNLQQRGESGLPAAYSQKARIAGDLSPPIPPRRMSPLQYRHLWTPA